MFLEMIANTAAAAAATTGLSEQAKFTMQHLQYLFQALTYAGAFAAIGFAAMGSAYGCGTACSAAVGAWKKCYSRTNRHRSSCWFSPERRFRRSFTA
ncbi:MAG: hypothetical protein V8T87_08530 [Victivallales bacterium]